MKCSFCGLTKNKLTKYSQEQEICSSCLENAKFLIRTSEGNILGPYNEDELSGLIESKIIVLLDEVSLNGSDWTFVKDIELFRNALAKSSYELDETTTSIPTNVINKAELPPIFSEDNISQHSEEKTNIRNIFDNSFYEQDKLSKIKDETKKTWLKPLFSSVFIVVLGFLGIFVYDKLKTLNTTSKTKEPYKNFSFNDYLLKAKEYFDYGLYKEADRFYQKVLELTPNSTSARLYHSAISLIFNDNVELARKFLSSLETETNMGKITDNNIKADINIFLGLLSLKNNNRDLALDYFKRVISISVSNKDAFYNLAVIYFQNGDLDKALSYINILLEQDSNDIDAITYKGLIFIKQDEYAKAVDTFTELIKKFPYSSMNYIFKSYALYKQENFDALKETLDKVSNLEPFFRSKLVVNIRRTNIKEYLEKKEREYLNELTEDINFKNYLSFYTAQAFVLAEEKEYKKAKLIVTDAIKRFKGDAQLYALLGMLYYQEKNYKVAMDYIEKALIQDYSNSLAHLYAALISLKNEDTLTQALNHAIKAYTANNLFLCALMLQGDVYYIFNQKTEAQMLWKKVLNIEPKYYTALLRVKLHRLLYKNN